MEMENSKNLREDMFLYDKQIVCPICGTEFSAHIVKTSKCRMKTKESDFYIKYSGINPYFYDVLLCDECGYASLKADFGELRKREMEAIKNNIVSKWHKREYPKTYDIHIALERYKLSLLNYSVSGSKVSKKAMNCLKISWMYRELGDIKNEGKFREQALIGFKEAYSTEELPIYGMDNYTVLYLIGELNRRSGNYEEALRYLGQVITSPSAGKRVKDLAINQKYLIEEMSKDSENNGAEDVIKESKETSIFSKLFKID